MQYFWCILKNNFTWCIFFNCSQLMKNHSSSRTHRTFASIRTWSSQEHVWKEKLCAVKSTKIRYGSGRISDSSSTGRHWNVWPAKSLSRWRNVTSATESNCGSVLGKISYRHNRADTCTTEGIIGKMTRLWQRKPNRRLRQNGSDIPRRRTYVRKVRFFKSVNTLNQAKSMKIWIPITD